MRFLDKRVAIICQELKRLSVKQKKEITGWRYRKGISYRPEEAEKEGLEPFDSHTMHWYGPDEHYWFYTKYTVPEELDGKPMWMHISTQVEEWDSEWDDGRNPQFLVFVNGRVLQGVDMNHRDIQLTDMAKAGDVYQIDLQAYTGTLHAEFCLIVDMMEVDMAVYSLYYDLLVPTLGLDRLNADDRNTRRLVETLNEGVNRIDLRNPYSAEFYASIKEAQEYLQHALYEQLAGSSEVIATCIGHTHIDVAWWWTVEQTREKVARSFSTVLKLMEEFPSYKFMSSQPQLYVFLKERYPELYEHIKERIKEGRWEVEGGMWVEADCNLTSGESLVRQFLHGKRFFREEFGKENRILWLPDVFGYSGNLPQIMKKSGIDYFMTTKLAWNQINKIPHDTFRWRGIDGSEVLTHFITTLDIGQPVSNFFTTYNGRLHPDAIIGGWQRYQDKGINNDILICYGHGDGGGGPTREMLETGKRMEKGIIGFPKVRQEFARTYFEELEERVKDNKRLGVWEGELYFEYHRGTYTSMARNKRANRKSELLMMDLELLSVLAKEECGLAYPQEDLSAMWKKILLNQFHDILPGSSIKEVYDVTKQEYEELAKKAEELLKTRLTKLAGTSGQNSLTLFNTLGFVRDDIVNLQDCSAEALLAEDGTRFPIQQTKEGAIAYVKGLPSKGRQCFTLENTSKHEDGTAAESVLPFTITEEGIETPFYRIRINEKGFFTSLYDKKAEREVLQAHSEANQMRMYEDKPMNYDNWDIDMYYTEKSWVVEDVSRMEWMEQGPVAAVLLLERKVSRSVIRQKIFFYAQSPRIDFKTEVDWKETQHLLKVHFPLDIHSDEATFEIQFGNVKRKIHSNTSWDEARFESCAHRWMDFSEGHYGVSLLNDCKYGHSAKDGNIALTLIKSGIVPNKEADKEEHVFTYALYPHEESWQGGKTVYEAMKLNQPVRTALGGVPGSKSSFVSVDSNHVVLETVKQAEDGDGIVIRLYECENARTKATLQFEKELAAAQECDLMEENPTEVSVDGHKLTFTIKPYEVKTFRVHFL